MKPSVVGRVAMRPIKLLLVAVLAATLPPTALAESDCELGEAYTIDVGGTMIYVVSEHDGDTAIYVESNGQVGLQCKDPDPDMRVI